MPVTAGFKAFIMDQLSLFGPVTIRIMFGGAGVYADGVMFAILVDDVLFLKADETTQRAFESEGMKPFPYKPANKTPVAMSYWEVPPRLLEEPDELVTWARQAQRIAHASKAKARR